MASEITREVAQKVLSAVDAGLVKGQGIQEPGKMCVEAAVCYALGLPAFLIATTRNACPAHFANSKSVSTTPIGLAIPPERAACAVWR